jgi:hypothetical protein
MPPQAGSSQEDHAPLGDRSLGIDPKQSVQISQTADAPASLKPQRSAPVGRLKQVRMELTFRYIPRLCSEGDYIAIDNITRAGGRIMRYAAKPS